ncbi:MAG: peptidylprolyl isomerase [Clostridia bacterium]|nr:peptidylprolyl isomerase [Clostridia bacterium]
MKDKSKVLLVAVILLVAAAIAWVCYGIFKGKQNPVVTMVVSYKDSEGNDKTGTVKIELYPEAAPESVNNFIALANNGYYDGLTFHRIVKNFVVQGGDKNGDGSGSAKLSDINKGVEAGSTNDYTYSIKGEFSLNGINNDIKFEKGVIGMARSDYSSYGLNEQGYNSASSQFFIVTTDDKASLANLNQNYASFGKVIEGYEYIEEIEKLYADKEESTEVQEVGSEEKDVPKTTSVRVETFGVKYALPNALNYDETLKLISQYQSIYSQLNQQNSDSNATVTEY